MAIAIEVELTELEAQLFEELDRREKEEVVHLQKLIKEAEGIVEGLQRAYVKLTGNRCL